MVIGAIESGPRAGIPLAFTPMITSIRNPKVQMVRALNAQAKARRESGAFVVEGVRLVEEAHAQGWLPEWVMYSQSISHRGMQLVQSYQDQGIQVEQVAPAVLKAASDTESPQGILAVLPLKQLSLAADPNFVLILDGVSDPGNLGTILRTASAAGVQAVLLTPGSADPFAPKVVRAGMGAHFHLPIRTFSWDEIVGYLAPEGADPRIKVYLADAGGPLIYTQAVLKSPLALIIGGEAEGAGDQARSLSQERIKIPMPGKAESLNVAAAAAILLFEVVRQRQTAGTC
jgi:RNA methyltransferase, TrmH family